MPKAGFRVLGLFTWLLTGAWFSMNEFVKLVFPLACFYAIEGFLLGAILFAVGDVLTRWEKHMKVVEAGHESAVAERELRTVLSR